jgi:hypothetical protein
MTGMRVAATRTPFFQRRMKNLTRFTIPLLTVLSCSPDRVTDTVHPRTPTHGARTVYQPTGFSEAALVTWLNQINNDCGNVVQGVLPTGSYTVSSAVELDVTDCGNPNRSVEIYGHGRDSTFINIQSLKDCGEGLGFVVRTGHVTIHDLALIGRKNADGSGNCGQGIKFEGAVAGFGTVYNTRVAAFGNAAIDAHYAPALYVHDNFIDCNGSGGTGATSGINSMGVWVRGVQTPPPEGMTNGSVNGNVIFGCANESIDVVNSINIVVEGNTIDCQYGGNTSGGRQPCDIGIVFEGVMNGEYTTCTSAPVKDGDIGYNRVNAHQRLNSPILIGNTGNGSGSSIVVQHNTITEAQQHGIQIANTACNGSAGSGYTGITVAYNDVANSRYAEYWIGGNSGSITNNRYHRGDFAGRGLNPPIVDANNGTTGNYFASNTAY